MTAPKSRSEARTYPENRARHPRRGHLKRLLIVAALSIAVVAVGDDQPAEDSPLVITGYRYRSGRWGLYTLGESQDELKELVPGGIHARYSPDRRYLAFVRGGMVWLRDMRTGANKAGPTSGQLCRRSDDLAWNSDSSALCFPWTYVRMAQPILSRPLLVKREGFGSYKPLAEYGRDILPQPEREADYGSPAFSPEGRLALCEFTALDGVGTLTSHIVLQSLKAPRRFHRITDWPDTDLELAPRWSPDGEKIAFTSVSVTDKRWRVHVYDVQSGELSAVDAPEAPEYAPPGPRHLWLFGWDPIGNTLLVGVGESAWGVTRPKWLFGLGGSNTLDVQPHNGWYVWAASWSADGKRVAYILTQSCVGPGESTPEVTAVFVWHRDTDTTEVVYAFETPSSR